MVNFSIYYLRFFNILIACLCFLNILYSYYFDLYLNVDSYFYTFLISIIPILSFFFIKKKEVKISVYTKIISAGIALMYCPKLSYYFLDSFNKTNNLYYQSEICMSLFFILCLSLDYLK